MAPGSPHFFHYLFQTLRIFLCGSGYPNQFTPRFGQLQSLEYGGVDVPGVGRGHGLNQDGRVATYIAIADSDLQGLAAAGSEAIQSVSGENS